MRPIDSDDAVARAPGWSSSCWSSSPSVAGLFFFLRSRGRKVDDRDVETAQAEIRAQLAVVATEIVEHEGTVDVSGNAEAIALFRQANATYVRVSEEIDRTTNLLDLAELNDDIDRARWQLEAAEALIEGRTPPPEPEPDAPGSVLLRSHPSTGYGRGDAAHPRR